MVLQLSHTADLTVGLLLDTTLWTQIFKGTSFICLFILFFLHVSSVGNFESVGLSKNKTCLIQRYIK